MSAPSLPPLDEGARHDEGHPDSPGVRNDATRGLAPVGHPDVKGRCPACGSSSLFLGSGGYVTCRISDCPDPSAAADMLLNSGLLKVTEDALIERNERLGRIERLARGEGA